MRHLCLSKILSILAKMLGTVKCNGKSFKFTSAYVPKFNSDMITYERSQVPLLLQFKGTRICVQYTKYQADGSGP